MTIDVKLAWLYAVLLCSIRIGALLLAMPFLQVLGLPKNIRVFLVLALSFSFTAFLHLQAAELPLDAGGVLVAGAHEAAIGALMAFGVFAAFAAFSLAGNLLDIEIGFNIANVFDPTTRAQSPLIAALFGMLAVALFFSLDAYQLFVRGLAYSFERLPLGGTIALADPSALIRQFGTVFSVGLVFAAPPLFCLFLVEIALGVLSRNLQQLNLFMLSPPIKMAAGMFVMAYSAGQLAQVSEKIFQSAFTFWEGVL